MLTFFSLFCCSIRRHRLCTYANHCFSPVVKFRSEVQQKKKKRNRKKKKVHQILNTASKGFTLRAPCYRVEATFFFLVVRGCLFFISGTAEAAVLRHLPYSTSLFPFSGGERFFFCTGESCIFFILHCCAHFSLLLFISFIFVFVLLLLLLRDTCQTTPRYCVSAIVPAVRSPLSPTAEVLGAETAKNLSAFFFFLPVCVHRPRVRSPGYTLFI